MDPTIVVAAITGAGSAAGLVAMRVTVRKEPPTWYPPAELTAGDLDWLKPHLVLTDKHWTRQQVGR